MDLAAEAEVLEASEKAKSSVSVYLVIPAV